MTSRPSDNEPRKAYVAVLPARVEKHILIWADSADDARRRFYDYDDDNVMVMDNEFFEGRLCRPRRMPSEDR